MIGGGGSTAPQNVNDRMGGKADSNYDIRQTITTNVSWVLPFGRGQRDTLRPERLGACEQARPGFVEAQHQG